MLYFRIIEGYSPHKNNQFPRPERLELDLMHLTVGVIVAGVQFSQSQQSSIQPNG
jgi:hypothetical protein